ncbi:putative nuclease HARBI1 [Trichonephila clavipes]|nr:putative nuclease HARBI1 [Trichonephila clavipes]
MPSPVQSNCDAHDTIANGQYGAVWSMGHTQQVCVRIVHLTSNVCQQFFGRSAFLRQQETDLPPAELWYLATGDLMASLSYLFRIGRSTTSAIIRETCKAISSSLKPIVLAKTDRTKWLDIAEAYYEQWQFPNCLGAIDRKHVLIQEFLYSCCLILQSTDGALRIPL